jgi:putative intracellular protease/amidase
MLVEPLEKSARAVSMARYDAFGVAGGQRPAELTPRPM